MAREVSPIVTTVSEVCQSRGCKIAPPWVYRRGGVYYLRIRPVGVSKDSFSLSLRTRQRETAMQSARRIEAALKTFHLDRPEDGWDVLCVPLKELAEETLWQIVATRDREAMSLEYTELLEDLRQIGGDHPLTSDQVKAWRVGVRIVQAAQARLLQDNPVPLGDLIDELMREVGKSGGVQIRTALPQVEAPVDGDALTLSKLSELYLLEQADKVRDRTLVAYKAEHRALAAASVGPDGLELDLRDHRREDMLRLRTALSEGRAPATVNKLLTRLSSLLTWAQNNGYLTKAYNKDLKLVKGTESTRKPFTEQQVETLMASVSSLPANSWQRWAVSLGAITGARIAELHQLTKGDIRTEGGITVIDLNEEGDKQLKNKQSNRVVPLVDGALGFDLQAFLQYVEQCGDRLFTLGRHRHSKLLNELLRETLGVGWDDGLSFHSLRHSMASRLKKRGTPAVIAQGILGHSSGTITFDHYGGTGGVEVGMLHAALRKAFSL